MNKMLPVSPIADKQIPGTVDEAVKPEEANLRPWWESVPVSSDGMGDALKNWAEAGLTSNAVRTGKTFFRGSASGIVGDNAKTILDNIELNQLGRRVYEAVRKKSEQPSKIAWAWESGAIVVDYYSHDDEIHVWAMATDQAVVKKVTDLVRRYVAPPKPEGKVYIIGDSPMSGPEFYSLGVASVPMERGNYEAETLKAFDGVVEEIKSPSPAGRLSVFDGPPGTGKTYLVRAILDQCPEAMFVFVLPSMMDALASPALIPLLIRRKQSRMTQGPMVFILEDGDNVLTPRGKENLSLISTLLNMTSGILGSMLDIRAIATTNSPKSDIDPALLRNGRLSQHVTVGPLSARQSQKVHARLTGGKQEPMEDGMTLADVYAMARKNGWKPKEAEAMKAANLASEGETVRSRTLGENAMIYPGKDPIVVG